MLNKSVLQTLLVAGTVVALEACTALPVKTDYNPNMSVASCHSYVFANEHVAQSDQQSAFGNPINAQRLREAIEANMASKGIPLATDHKAAECVVGYAMGTRQVFNDYYGDFGVGWGWGGGWRRGGWGGGFADGPVAYDETRISIDLFDAKSRTPIWHASVSQSVSDLTGPNAVQRINTATAAIFTKFPVGATLPAGARTTT